MDNRLRAYWAEQVGRDYRPSPKSLRVRDKKPTNDTERTSAFLVGLLSGAALAFVGVVLLKAVLD